MTFSFRQRINRMSDEELARARDECHERLDRGRSRIPPLPPDQQQHLQSMIDAIEDLRLVRLVEKREVIRGRQQRVKVGIDAIEEFNRVRLANKSDSVSTPIPLDYCI